MNTSNLENSKRRKKPISCRLGFHFVPQLRHYSSGLWLWSSAIITRHIGESCCIDCGKGRVFEQGILGKDREDE